MDEIRRRREKKKNEFQLHAKHTISSFLVSFLTRLGITIVLVLLLFIVCKKDQSFSSKFYHQVLETNLSFAQINKWYETHFGSPIPFQNLIKREVTPVFQETLTYKDSSKYLDGVSLEVEEHYLVPILTSGVVVFVGEKEGYGKTVIIGGNDGVDIWYGNLKEINVKLYDQVEESFLLGEVNDKTLYLVFKKGGKVENYDEYLKYEG